MTPRFTFSPDDFYMLAAVTGLVLLGFILSVPCDIRNAIAFQNFMMEEDDPDDDGEEAWKR